jgi:hypothetical protein
MFDGRIFQHLLSVFLRIPTVKWKIVENSLCNFCKLDEDYSHCVITCTFLKEFWTKFQNLNVNWDHQNA